MLRQYETKYASTSSKISETDQEKKSEATGRQFKYLAVNLFKLANVANESITEPM